MTVFLSLMGEQRVSRQSKQCHRTTSWAKCKLFSRLSSMFLRQLGKNLKFGQPPASATPMKKADSGEASLEEDLSPASPMEVVTQQDAVLSDAENRSSDTPGSRSPLSLPEARSEMEEKVAPVKPSRPKRHFSSAGTIESVNLDAIPLAIARLDNSAAKHKLSVKPKNQRVSKKHRRLGLARDRSDEQGGLPCQLPLDQNGHPGEDKPAWHEEEPEPLDSEEEQRRQEEYWRQLEAKCKLQKAEAAERRRLEELRLQALERRLWEENRGQELLEEEEEEEGEGRAPQLDAGKRPGVEERQRLEEEQGGRGPEQSEQEEGGRQEADVQGRPGDEAEPRQDERGAQSRPEAEQPRREEEERRWEELGSLEGQRQEETERQRREEEARKRRQQEEEERRLAELGRPEALQGQKWREEEERKRRDELSEGPEAVEAQGLREVGQEPRGAPSVEEESPLRSDGRSPLPTEFAEKAEQEHLPPERERAGAPGVENQSREAEPPREQPAERRDVPARGGCVRREKEEAANTSPHQKPGVPAREMRGAAEKKEAAPLEKDRQGEELRWKELDERQTTPRPYTFQVSSGGKQILFPKVNLSPVTPATDPSLASPPHQPKAATAGPASHTLPSSLSIPHTAILVTGAQLCGPAVNLSQIKDTACKSLLGLSEERKHVEVPTLESSPRAPTDPRAGSRKARPPQESPSSVAALAEWASIRSRILKSSESDQGSKRDQSQPGEEHTPRGRCDSRGNLRKTPPVNAKFSIMPAWQKFSDGGAETPKQSTEAEGTRKRPVLGASDETGPPPLAADGSEHQKGTENLGVHQEPADTTEGCKFAKDLPSFLVPSPPYPLQKAVAHTEPATLWDKETTSGVGKPDAVMPGGEEKASLFGIKLRRTNYSLRFHCDQQTDQKKKKRHSSIGDGMDGALPAPGSTNGEKETEGVALKHGPSLPLERKPAPPSLSTESPPSHSPAAQPGPPPVSLQTPVQEHKAANRMPVVQKPALAPKPADKTPPPSPLCRLSRPYLGELLARRPGKPDLGSSEPCKESQESSDPWPPSPPPPEERKAQRRDKEEEMETERKPASPALSAAPQEKPPQTPEAGRKEKPALQSRHSLDGSRLAETADAAQPLWVTLALQKQKGFREQQATREERKQAREAKQAEKLSKDHAGVGPPPGSSSVSRAGSLHKAATQPEDKKLETAGSRLERRDQLKKANTLPTSVTVEISDATPAAPLVKEVTKRFSTPDTAPASTEPAWLALAKRKAKAWSDCPQIIK